MSTARLRTSAIAAMVIAATSLVTTTASAEIITYTFEGSASGSLDGQSFGMSDFVINVQADTENLDFDLILTVPNNSATITIDGLGTYEFITPTLTALDDFNDDIYLSWGPELFDGPDIMSVGHGAFAGWGMDTELGPVVGDGDVYSHDTIDTTGGVLDFNTNGNPITFTATIPAPGAIALVGLCGLIRRRRRDA